MDFGLKGELKNIFIIAKGPTWSTCPKKENLPPDSELWGLNSVYRDRPDIDRLFIMHDIRATMVYEDKNLVPELNNLGVPVYTAGPYKVLDHHREYPAEMVVKHFNVAYMLNSICWMLALAIMFNPEKIWLYGADFAFGIDIDEKACTEFWVGLAVGRGIKVQIPPDSHLVKPPEMRQPLYGYVLDRTPPDGLITGLRTTLRPDMLFGGAKCAPQYKLVPIGEEQ